MTQTSKSPCLGICSTVYGDNVCKGCKRFVYEVIEWNAWSDSQKSAVYDRLEQMMDQSMQAKLQVFDSSKLEAYLLRYGIVYAHFASVHWWLYLLWVKRPDVLVDWQDLGVKVAKAYKGLAPGDLLNQVDDEVNALAEQAFALM